MSTEIIFLIVFLGGFIAAVVFFYKKRKKFQGRSDESYYGTNALVIPDDFPLNTPDVSAGDGSPDYGADPD
jgi:cbb3-type cytochrome oxidase subunit 3